jgi:hypothetical protein
MNLYSFNFVQFTFLTITLILSHFLWFFDTFWQSGIFYFGYVPTEWYFLFLICSDRVVFFICSDSGIFYFWYGPTEWYFWYVPTVVFFLFLICSDRVVFFDMFRQWYFFIFDMFRQSGIFYFSFYLSIYIFKTNWLLLQLHISNIKLILSRKIVTSYYGNWSQVNCLLHNW